MLSVLNDGRTDLMNLSAQGKPIKHFIDSEKYQNFTVQSFVIASAYKKAYAQIVRQASTTSTEDAQLSIDIVGLDSVSYAQFQRDAPLTWAYMRNVMGTKILKSGKIFLECLYRFPLARRV